jgi:opacity protein-like surface antigen
MKRSFVAGAVLTCVLTGSAVAADMPTKAPVYRPDASSWSSFYVGAVAGAGIVRPQFATLDNQAFSNFHAGDWASPAAERSDTTGNGHPAYSASRLISTGRNSTGAA